MILEICIYIEIFWTHSIFSFSQCESSQTGKYFQREYFPRVGEIFRGRNSCHTGYEPLSSSLSLTSSADSQRYSQTAFTPCLIDDRLMNTNQQGWTNWSGKMANDTYWISLEKYTFIPIQPQVAIWVINRTGAKLKYYNVHLQLEEKTWEEWLITQKNKWI